MMNLAHTLTKVALAEIESYFRNEMLIAEVHRQAAAEGGDDSPYWTGKKVQALTSMQWFGIDGEVHCKWVYVEAKAMMKDGRYREVLFG